MQADCRSKLLTTSNGYVCRRLYWNTFDTLPSSDISPPTGIGYELFKSRTGHCRDCAIYWINQTPYSGLRPLPVIHRVAHRCRAAFILQPFVQGAAVLPQQWPGRGTNRPLPRV